MWTASQRRARWPRSGAALNRQNRPECSASVTERKKPAIRSTRVSTKACVMRCLSPLGTETRALPFACKMRYRRSHESNHYLGQFH